MAEPGERPSPETQCAVVIEQSPARDAVSSLHRPFAFSLEIRCHQINKVNQGMVNEEKLDEFLSSNLGKKY